MSDKTREYKLRDIIPSMGYVIFSSFVDTTKTLSIEIGGEISKGDIGGIINRIEEAKKDHPDYNHLIFDMEKLKYINHEGLEMLANYKKQEIGVGKGFTIKNPVKQPKLVLDKIKNSEFTELKEIYDSLENCIEYNNK